MNAMRKIFIPEGFTSKPFCSAQHILWHSYTIRYNVLNNGISNEYISWIFFFLSSLLIIISLFLPICMFYCFSTHFRFVFKQQRQTTEKKRQKRLQKCAAVLKPHTTRWLFTVQSSILLFSFWCAPRLHFCFFLFIYACMFAVRCTQYTYMYYIYSRKIELNNRLCEHPSIVNTIAEFHIFAIYILQYHHSSHIMFIHFIRWMFFFFAFRILNKSSLDWHASLSLWQMKYVILIKRKEHRHDDKTQNALI